jgi:hypothetical protein
MKEPTKEEKRKILRRRITNYNTTGIRIALDGRLSSLVPRENQDRIGIANSIVVLAFSLLFSMHFIPREREKKRGEK